MEKFETKQYFSKKEKSVIEDEKLEKIEIPEKDWQIIEIIAKRVGGDFGMEIKLGKPGDGSFFNTEDCSITFDPLHIRDDIEQAKFVAGHEGSHRAITPNPKEIGLSQEQIQKYYSQIGFGYLQNVIEDLAVNDWMRKRFPGLESCITKNYDKQLKEENVVLSIPEVQKIAAQLGYWPKFAQYGSEIIRDWHKKRFSEKLDPAVEKALKRTINLARENKNIIPDPQMLSSKKEEIIIAGQERFKNNTNDIWPEVKKLVEMDLHTEEQRQMLQKFRQEQKELEQKIQEMEKAQKQDNNQKQEELQKEINDLKKELDPFSGLSKDVKKELQEKIDKAVQEAVKGLNKKVEEKQNQSEQELKDAQDTLENIQSGEEMPYPEDKLSDKTKEDLKKLFDSLSKDKQKDLHEKAKQKLENFEDAINKEIEGKLNEDKSENHKEQRERKESENESIFEKTKIEEEKKGLEKKLEQMRREGMTEYDKTYEEVSDIIKFLYIRLKKFFLPERHPKWLKGYSTGSRLDMEKAMQAEADPRYLEKLWERKTIPHKLDYHFSILVDLSGSMSGEKIEETFKGVVVLAEVLEKLGIQYEILGFSNKLKIFKEWKRKLNKESREYLLKMKNWGNQGTNTTEATKMAYNELLNNLGKNNFLITLTDGQPDDSKSLKQELEKIKKEKKVKLIGIGLGPDTEFVENYYPEFLFLPNIKPTNQQKKQGQKDFSEVFADLLEDIIRHPEKY